MTVLQKRWWLGKDLVWRARGESPVSVSSTPVASFTSTPSGLGVAFNASASTDTGSTLTGWAWDFGDGTTGQGVTVSHQYQAVGTYTVMLTVSDGLNNTDSTVSTVSVAVGRPTASFTLATVNLVAQFDASASTDVGSTISTYAWAFGDGSTGSGKTASHTYTAAGTFTATLTVTDATGQTATASHSLSVASPPANQAPTASFSTTVSGATVSVNGSGSSDPDGSVAGYAWTWGDGSTSAGVTSSHTYATAGTYTVSLTVTDNSGAKSSAASKTVTVTPAATGPVVAAFTSSNAALTVTADGRSSTAATPTPPIYYLNDAPDPTSALTFTLAQPSAMQCAVKSPDTGYWYVSQRTNGSNGSSTPYETLTISRCDGTTGALVDSMTITNGGHGTGFALEYSGTTLYVWVALQVPATTGGTTWDIVRFPYRAGTYTRSAVPSLQVMFLNSQVGSGGKAHVYFDVPNGFCVTYDEITPTNTVYKRWVLSDFLAKKLTQSGSTVTTTFSNILQGWAGVGDSLFVYTGGQNTPSTDPIYLREYSFASAKLTAQRDLTGMGANSDGTYPTGTYEPESLSVVQTAAGATPRLYLGLTLGASGSAHTFPLYSTAVPGTNRVAAYAWAWGDGATSSGATPSHTYATAGTYTVTLTVTDNSGATAGTSKSVTVGSARDSLVYDTYIPDDSNTGVLGDHTTYPVLTGTGGQLQLNPGDVITRKWIKARVMRPASGVAYLNDCYIDGAGYTFASNTGLIDCTNGNSGVVVATDCTLIPANPNLWVDGIIGHDYKAFRCRVRHTVDGFGVYNGHNSNGPVGVEIAGCYVDGLAYFINDPNHTNDHHTHNDGVQIQGNSGALIHGNNIRAFIDQTVGDGSSSAFGTVATGQAIAYTPNVGAISGVQVKSNYLDGGANTITAILGNYAASNIGVIDKNTFGRRANSGRTVVITPTDTFTGNVGTYADNGAAVTPIRATS